ncbi:hypothetical protein Pcinc_035855 [Petrolisthes cinctipes]|uniref:Uncharacterized protein n=1 Tax=Petrolisthes cinctipes TaxID=88211 RepID=A0AAE1EMJ7_PETCI|nr:hypothetical protein Pcinc_035855 [Petrolisthes cinctipes]
MTHEPTVENNEEESEQGNSHLRRGTQSECPAEGEDDPMKKRTTTRMTSEQHHGEENGTAGEQPHREEDNTNQSTGTKVYST